MDDHPPLVGVATPQKTPAKTPAKSSSRTSAANNRTPGGSRGKRISELQARFTGESSVVEEKDVKRSGPVKRGQRLANCSDPTDILLFVREL